MERAGVKVGYIVQCPLCGSRFDAREASACQGCPKLLRGCGMIACPRCSHEFPKEGA